MKCIYREMKRDTVFDTVIGVDLREGGTNAKGRTRLESGGLYTGVLCFVTEAITDPKDNLNRLHEGCYVLTSFSLPPWGCKCNSRI